MPNKALIQRLQSDTKRHRAPQIDILPDWVKTAEKRVVASGPVVVQIEKNSEKGKKSDKKAKKKKK